MIDYFLKRKRFNSNSILYKIVVSRLFLYDIIFSFQNTTANANSRFLAQIAQFLLMKRSLMVTIAKSVFWRDRRLLAILNSSGPDARYPIIKVSLLYASLMPTLAFYEAIALKFRDDKSSYDPLSPSRSISAAVKLVNSEMREIAQKSRHLLRYTLLHELKVAVIPYSEEF